MTIQELKELHQIVNDKLNGKSNIVDLGKELDKLIPKKPTSLNRTAHDFSNGYCKNSGNYCEYIKPYSHEYKYTDYKCPCCGYLCSDGTPNFCWNCGQALDWSEV